MPRLAAVSVDNELYLPGRRSQECRRTAGLLPVSGGI